MVGTLPVRPSLFFEISIEPSVIDRFPSTHDRRRHVSRLHQIVRSQFPHGRHVTLPRQMRLLDSDSSAFELGAALTRMLPRSESESKSGMDRRALLSYISDYTCVGGVCVWRWSYVAFMSLLRLLASDRKLAQVCVRLLSILVFQLFFNVHI